MNGWPESGLGNSMRVRHNALLRRFLINVFRYALYKHLCAYFDIRLDKILEVTNLQYLLALCNEHIKTA